MNINKTYVAIAGAAVAGLAIGGTAGYFITKKVCKDKYEASLQKTIDALKRDYESEIALLKGEEVEEDAEEDEAEEESEEDSEEDEEESDGRSPVQVINYTKFSSNIKTPDMPKDLKEGVINLIGHDDDVDEEMVSPPEIIKQPRPYLISIDQFNDDLVEDARPWYDKKELILYMKDFIYINGEKINVPILYSCDDDAIIDVFVDEEVSKKLESIGIVKCGKWERANIEINVDDFGHPDFDYKPYEQVKRCDDSEIECYVDKRDDKSYAEDMLDIENVTESNYRDVYDELWQKPKE